MSPPCPEMCERGSLRGPSDQSLSFRDPEMQAYYEQLGAGESEDAEQEARLRDELRQAREKAEPQHWAARHDGAARAREQAEAERDAEGRAIFAELAAEETALDEPVRAELQEAWRRFQAAESAYAARVRRWHALAPYGGLSAEDIPGLPTSGSPDQVRSRFVRGVEPPTPRPLLRREEDEAT